MSQNQQFKKVKLYRTLKTVFYILGLPLFFFAVFLASVKFIGRDPFIGESDAGLFTFYLRWISAPALYGIWIAAGIWAFIAIVQIVFGKIIKNYRTRMIAVIAVTLIVMLGSMFIMDISFSKQADNLAANAPEGVTVHDYKTQLSYYRALTSSSATGGSSYTDKIISQVELLQKVYHVDMYGANKGGTAGNIGHNPVYYDNIISDSGYVGVDISYDENGKLTETPNGSSKDDHILITKAPDASGRLSFSADATGGEKQTYSHYVCTERTAVNGHKVYIWYVKDLMPTSETPIDGIYGTAMYNKNGMLADGWVPSLYNVLEILEDYYGGKAEIDKALKDENLAGIYTDFDSTHAQIMQAARERREEYYENTSDPWLAEMYKQEIYFTENFSLTRAELDELLAQVGAMLGSNKLFDWVFDPNSLVGGLISEFVPKLKEGFTFGELLADKPDTVASIANVFGIICGDDTITDVYIKVFYPSEEDKELDPDAHFYIEIRKNNRDGEIILDIDFDDALINGDPDNPDYAFDLDHLSAFLNNTLNRVLDHFGVDLNDSTISTILGLFIKDVGNGHKGLTISGLTIPIFDEYWRVDIDVTGILTNLLDTLYWYQSPLIKPIYEFYVDPDETMDEITNVQKYFAEYDKAYYEATLHGKLVGSIMLGDTLGEGSYPSSLGLSNLAGVQQLKTDLSYMRYNFPVYAVRDMLMVFTGVVILFMFLSYIAAEKEMEYATGVVVDEEKSKKSRKKNKNTDDVADSDASDANADGNQVVNADDAANNSDAAAEASAQGLPPEADALPVEENTEKEVR